MKHMPGMALLAKQVAMGLIILHSQVVAKDVRVPEDYPTINAAIQAAKPGQDRVVVKGGATYKETVVVNKDIEIVSVPEGARITADGSASGVKGTVPEPPKNGLRGYWKLDSAEGGKVRDFSGKGLEGSFVGKPVLQPEKGLVGGGIEFRGDGCISVPTGDRLDIKEEMTVAAFIKVGTIGFDVQYFVSQAVQGDQLALWALTREGAYSTLVFVCRPNDEKRMVKVPIALNDGRWHHVAGVYTGREMQLYIDGALSSSLLTSGTLPRSNGKVCIGKRCGFEESPEYGVQGMVDEVTIYNRALTKEEIWNLATREESLDAEFLQDGVIITSSASHVQMDGFIIENCGRHGVFLTPDRKSAVDFSLRNMTIQTNKECGVLFLWQNQQAEENQREFGQSKISLVKCVLRKNTGNGLVVRSQPPLRLTAKENMDLSLMDSRVESNGDIGVLFDLSEAAVLRCRIEGCSFRENRRDGIRTTWGDLHLEVKASSLMENGGPGIVCSASNGNAPSSSPGDVTLTSCTLVGNKAAGLNISAKTNLNASVSKCNISANGGDGVYLYPYLGSTLTLQLKDSVMARNTGNGLGWITPCEVQIGRCNVSNNTLAGLYLGSSGELTAEDCRFSNNGREGVVFAPETSALKEGEPVPVSHASFSGCSMTSNKNAGVLFANTKHMIADIRHCELSGNQDGLYVTPSKQGRTVVSISNLICSSNILGDVKLGDPCALVFAEQSADNPASSSARACLLSQSTCLLIDPPATDVMKSVTFLPGGAAWQKISMPPFSLPVATAQDALSLLSKAIPEPESLHVKALAKIPFEELERDFAKLDGAGALLEIGERFAQHAGVDRSKSAEAALQYIVAHPDSALSCRLFQNLAGDVLPFDDPKTAKTLAGAVVKSPNSSVADSICTELVMAALMQPEMSEPARSFTQNCQVPSDSLAGLLLSCAVPKEGQSPRERWAAFRASWAKAGTTYSTQRERSCGKASRIVDVEDKAGLNSAIHRCDTLVNLLDLAVIWHQIGKPEMAGKFLSLAARNRLAFYPSTPDTYCLPASLSRAYQNTAKALNAGKPIPEITQIATLAEIMNDAGVTTAAISARTCLYRDAADLFSTLVKSKEIPGDWTEGEYDRAVFQVFVEELVEVCKHTSRPEVFLSYAAALRDYPQHQSSNLTVRQGLLGHLAPEDRLDGSKWFVEQAKPFIKDKPGFAEVFHSFFSDLFQRENDVTNEAFHLGELAKMNRQTDAAHAQFQRLSDLYLDQWKLPAQAIQVQRRIIEVFPNCDKEWQARLKIAKIQYSETAFQEAIYELTLLLAKLPQDYQDAPARTMLGLAYVAAAAYEDARDQFAQVINKDTGEYREQCLYLVGYSYICEQKYSEAVKPFKDLVNLYPNGPHTTTAKDFLGKIEGTGAKK